MIYKIIRYSIIIVMLYVINMEAGIITTIAMGLILYKLDYQSELNHAYNVAIQRLERFI